MDLGLKNAEGYYDLTAYEAIKNVSDNEKFKPKNIVYVCSPLSGDIDKNQQKACEYCKFVVEKGHIPMAVHLMFPRFMNDNNNVDRTKAITMGLDILARCDELWCFGEEISKGMLVGLMFASNHMIKIRHFTEDCKFISNKGVIGNGD
jgi:hypothetical protein